MVLRATIALALCLFATDSVAAELPIYPVDANCREATATLFEGSQLSAARRKLFEQNCISTQQNAYDAVASIWTSLQAQDQKACLHLVQTTNYILLERCVSERYAQETGEEKLSRKSFRP